MRKHRLPDNENNVTTNNIDDGSSHVKTSASNAESYDSSHLHPLSLSVHIEQNEYEYSTAHNVWSMIKLRANDNGYMNFTKQRVAVDFVVAVDVSGSMNDDNKLSSMLATLEYMVELLDDRDRLAIVKFNDRSSVIHPLSFMNQTNKCAVLSLLSSFPTPSGNTNLSDALFTSLDILLAPSSSSSSSQTIDQKEKNRISRLFLLTDGQANRGLTYDSIIDQLELIQLPSSLTIHCFGFGSDHHPSCLQRIAFCSNGGLYHYIADHKSIAPTFGQCLAGIFSTVAYNISVNLEAFDGCRFLQFKTKCPIQSKQSMKKYTISVGSMYEHEERSIVIKQSLRAMNSISEHTLFRVSVSYQSCLPSDDDDHDHDPSNNHRLLECIFSVKRNAITSLKMNNWDEWSATACHELMRQLNRIDAAEAIDKSLQFAATQNFGLALQTIQSAILKIKNRRISSGDPFSLDILEGLNDCIYYFSHPSLFLSCGIHPIHSYSTMYNQERSSDVIFSSYRQNRSRTYGYTTPIQHSEIQSASEIFSSSISRYTKVQ